MLTCSHTLSLRFCPVCLIGRAAAHVVRWEILYDSDQLVCVPCKDNASKKLYA